MRITIGDAKGKAMVDKRKLVVEYLTKEDLQQKKPIVLVFKDLGLQISWKLVFIIEYFGPILITALLVAF